MDDVTEPPITDLAPPGAEHLTYGEVLEAITGLSDLERARLDLLERPYLNGTDFAEGDLLHEALCSALFGEKKCPRTTPFVAFVLQSIRNISGRRRSQLRRQVPITGGTTHDEHDGRCDIADDRPDAEEQFMRAEDEARATSVWAVLQPQYELDEQIQLVLLGWEEGMRGKDLRELVGVTQDELNYIIKRIRRIAAKHYPKGWRI